MSRIIRAQKRREERELRKSGGDIPLTYAGGFMHKTCGHPAERPTAIHLGMHCMWCQSHFPHNEFRVMTKDEKELYPPEWYAMVWAGSRGEPPTV